MLARATRRSLWLAALALAAACNDDSLAPFEPEIGNAADNFQFQVTALDRVSATPEYEWQNTGTTANVNQSASLSAGSAVVVIRDAQGAQVYRRSLTENGTFQTQAGTAGRWRIRVELAGASGAVNFRVQRRTP
ncbi:MAG TPA: hypothetical protein VEA99_18780 [Gemmatimonadaceae bacterium]|nr:hypothetical protein [Gemmatimonadaceae bacterium]